MVQKKRILYCLCLFCILFVSVFSVVNCDGEDWLDGWGYRQSHTITGSSGAGTGYQIRVVIDFGSGSSSGNTCYVDGDCQTDFDDIRFTDNDGDTVLDYWLFEKIDSDYAIFWVEVLDNLDTDQIVYVYYGNDDAVSLSDGDDTFYFFDEFSGSSINTTKWAHDTSDCVVSGGIMTMTTSGASDHWIEMNSANYAYLSSPFDYAMDFSAKFYASTWSYVGFRQVSRGNDCTIFYYASTNDLIFTRDSGGTTSQGSEWTVGSWYDFSITLDSSEASFYVDGVEQNNSPLTTNLPDTNQGININVGNLDAKVIQLDYIFLHKYDSGVSHGAWGDVESLGGAFVPYRVSFVVVVSLSLLVCMCIIVFIKWCGWV